jgi:hypothetical protein
MAVSLVDLLVSGSPDTSPLPRPRHVLAAVAAVLLAVSAGSGIRSGRRDRRA